MRARVAPDAVGLVAETPRAGVLLKPLRLRILAHAREPASATRIAANLGLSRQQVNYHVRALARAGFLRRAGRQRKRGLVEQNYVVTARAFVLGPNVLGPMTPAHDATADKMTAAYLLALGGNMQREVAQAWHGAQRDGKRLPVLSLDTDVRFESPEQRARFADALTAAITSIVAEHTTPATAADGTPTVRGRFRLVLGCYPIPRKDPS